MWRRNASEQLRLELRLSRRPIPGPSGQSGLAHKRAAAGGFHTTGLPRIEQIGSRPLILSRVTSPVVVNVGVRGRGRRHHGGARQCGRHGHHRASENRAGCSERQDSGNDDGSPYAHDLSKIVSPEVSGPAAALRRARTAYLTHVVYCRYSAISCIKLCLSPDFSRRKSFISLDRQ